MFCFSKFGFVFAKLLSGVVSSLHKFEVSCELRLVLFGSFQKEKTYIGKLNMILVEVSVSFILEG